MNLRHQSGVIMIEVLVSIAVLAFGILGLAALQTYTLQAAKEAYTRSIASDLSNDLAERIRALRCSSLSIADSGQEPADTCNNYTEPNFATVFPACTRTSATIECKEFGFVADDGHVNDDDSGSDVSPNDTKAGLTGNRWTRLVAKSLPNGVATICKDSLPNNTEKYLDLDDQVNLVTNIAATCSGGANDPLVIKIWWTERAARKGVSNSNGYFYTTLQ